MNGGILVTLVVAACAALNVVLLSAHGASSALVVMCGVYSNRCNHGHQYNYQKIINNQS
jgi:hypothetical protein